MRRSDLEIFRKYPDCNICNRECRLSLPVVLRRQNDGRDNILPNEPDRFPQPIAPDF
jgi:hypothetical protein